MNAVAPSSLSLSNGDLKLSELSALSYQPSANQGRRTPGAGGTRLVLGTSAAVSAFWLKAASRRLNANSHEGFDPGSERTLAAWIRHASRTNPRGATPGGKWRKGQ